jgi:hypothetical protein
MGDSECILVQKEGTGSGKNTQRRRIKQPASSGAASQ